MKDQKEKLKKKTITFTITSKRIQYPRNKPA